MDTLPPDLEFTIDMKLDNNIFYKFHELGCKRIRGICSSEDLGLGLIGIKQIAYGGCISDVGELHHEPTPNLTAHTHKCPHDPNRNTICFSRARWILYNDGSPSDLFWHEYAHVLNDSIYDGVSVTCGIPHRITKYTPEKFSELVHGKKWSEILKQLGKGHISGPTVHIDYSSLIPTDEEFVSLFLTRIAA